MSNVLLMVRLGSICYAVLGYRVAWLSLSLTALFIYWAGLLSYGDLVLLLYLVMEVENTM